MAVALLELSDAGFVSPALFFQLYHPPLHLEGTLLLTLEPLIELDDSVAGHPQLIHQTPDFLGVVVLVSHPLKRLALVELNPLHAPDLLLKRRDHCLAFL